MEARRACEAAGLSLLSAGADGAKPERGWQRQLHASEGTKPRLRYKVCSLPKWVTTKWVTNV